MVLLLLRRALPNVKVGSLATIIKYMMTDDCKLRDALVDTTECDREKLISVCHQWIPEEMNFTEALVFISALSKMGDLEFNDMNPFNGVSIGVDFDHEGLIYGVEVNGSSSCTFDGDGRIIELSHSDETTSSQETSSFEFSDRICIITILRMDDKSTTERRSY
jgi:hypothetical protein